MDEKSRPSDKLAPQAWIDALALSDAEVEAGLSVIELSPSAERQLSSLLRHYARLGRTKAGRNLLAAIDHAASQIARAPDMGVAARRPYPGSLPRHG